LQEYKEPGLKEARQSVQQYCRSEVRYGKLFFYLLNKRVAS